MKNNTYDTYRKTGLYGRFFFSAGGTNLVRIRQRGMCWVVVWRTVMGI